MRAKFKTTSLATVAAIALASLLTFSGCSAEVSIGEGSDASGEELAEEIQGDYAEQSGVALRGLTCEGVEGEDGETFGCTGRNERSVQLEISGEVTGTSGGGDFDYDWHVTKAIAPGVLYERALRRQIEERGVGLSEVRCPVEIDVEVGEELECKATDHNGITRAVSLRLTDLDGGFDYSVEEEGGPESSATS
jgi:Domain of unknown function (DUF4333)